MANEGRPLHFHSERIKIGVKGDCDRKEADAVYTDIESLTPLQRRTFTPEPSWMLKWSR